MSNIVQIILDYYLKSGDFKGYHYCDLLKGYYNNQNSLLLNIKTLVEQEKIAINDDGNPHIKRLPLKDIEQQIELINSNKITSCCFYPTNKYLQEKVNKDDYSDYPYTLELALGTPQLEYRVFDLEILEQYKNDARYEYDDFQCAGKITIKNEYCSDGEDKADYEIVLERFGICFHKENRFNRKVAVFLRDLKNLNSKHQKLWKLSEINNPEEFYLHPIYKAIFYNDWTIKLTITRAILLEIDIINKMCDVMQKPHLFLNSFEGDKKPENFTILLRPTKKEFENFILTLDKMLSENLNKKFFKENNIIEEQKGTISLLNEYLNKEISILKINKTPKDVENEIISIFREIEKMRQEPAHKHSKNTYDENFFEQQDRIFGQIYNSLYCMRLFFSNNISVKQANIKIPQHLCIDNIYFI